MYKDILSLYTISDYGFDLCFPDNEWCWTSFHVPAGHLYVFFGKIFQFFAHFWIGLFLLLSLKVLYILDVNPLSDICFANTFSHSVGCLFTLGILSFDAYILKIFVKSKFSMFSFVTCAFGVTSKKYLPNPRSCAFVLCVLLSILLFRVLHLGPWSVLN